MRTRNTVIASSTAGIAGLGLAFWGLSTGDPLVVQGELMGGGPVTFPSVVPFVAVAAAVALAIVALLLPLLRTRDHEAPLANTAAANAPLIVSGDRDEVTFVWGESRGSTQRRGTQRPALTRA